MLREGHDPSAAPDLGGRGMVRYVCGACGRRWTGHGRKPGGEVFCPKCGKVAYTYAKAIRPMGPEKAYIRPPEGEEAGQADEGVAS